MTLSCAVPQGLLPLLSSQGGAFRLSRGPPLGLSPPITWDSPPRWADESCSWTSSSDPGLPAGEGSPHLQLEMADYKLPTALPAPSPPTVAAPSSQLSGQKLGPPSLPTAHPALETACQPSHRTRPESAAVRASRPACSGPPTCLPGAAPPMPAPAPRPGLLATAPTSDPPGPQPLAVPGSAAVAAASGSPPALCSELASPRPPRSLSLWLFRGLVFSGWQAPAVLPPARPPLTQGSFSCW